MLLYALVSLKGCKALSIKGTRIKNELSNHSDGKNMV